VKKHWFFIGFELFQQISIENMQLYSKLQILSSELQISMIIVEVKHIINIDESKATSMIGGGVASLCVRQLESPK
jgi:hypothetical protein